MSRAITKFRGDSYYLSNRSDYTVDFFGLVYNRSENAFQAIKCVNTEHRKTFCNLSFKDAKDLGKRVSLRGD